VIPFPHEPLDKLNPLFNKISLILPPNPR